MLIGNIHAFTRRRQWRPTPVLLPGKSHGKRSLVGCSPWGCWVGHDWVTSLSLFTFMLWRGKWQPTPVFLPGKSHGRRSLVGCCPWGRWESDTTEQLHFTFHFHALEKEMATHSSVLAWRIPGTGEPGGLPSMGSRRVRHDWSDLAAGIHLEPSQGRQCGGGEVSELVSKRALG